MNHPGRKNTAPEISEPFNARPAGDQTHPQMVAEVDPTVRSSGTEGLGHPDPVHVYGGGADKLGGPNTVSNPKQEHEVDQLPMDNAAQGTSTLHDNPNVQVVERKLPFKDQVKAYHKIHRGTLLGDREQKETGKRILAGEIPPQ